MAREELFTAKDAEDAKENKQNQHQKQRRSTTGDTASTHPNEPKPGSLEALDAEEGKTVPLIHGDMGLVADEQQRVKQRAEELVRRIGETCDELERLAEENPELVRRVTRRAEEPKDAYLRLKARLQLADAMPRCRWIKQGGTTCGSPQMKDHIYCFAHRQMAEAQALALRLPPPEDANAIQVGLMRIQKALIEDTITTRKAGLLLYSMQLALTNVGQTTFGQAKDEELVRETVDEEEAISSQRSAFSQNKNFFTTEDTEKKQELPLINSDDTDRESLRRMHADRRGVQRGIKQIEWKPSPDMYKMDTREGREAYEASLRKIAPRPCAEGRTPQPGMGPDNRAETYAVLG